MANSDRIGTIVSAGTITIPTEGFSIPLIIGQHNRTAERAVLFGGDPDTILDGMLLAGFDRSDNVYRATKVLLEQEIKTKAVLIGRRIPGASNQENTITVTGVVADATYFIDLQHGNDGYITRIASYIAKAGDADTDVMAGLLEQVAKFSNYPFDVVNNGNNATFTFHNTLLHTFTVSPGMSQTTDTAAGPAIETVTDCLAAIEAEGHDFYGVMLTSPVDTDNKELIDYYAGQPKFPAGFTSSDEVLNAVSGNVMELCQTAARSAIFCFVEKYWEFPHIALHGERMALESAVADYPKSSTWSTQSLVGMSEGTLTFAQKTNIENQGGIFFDRAGGRFTSMTFARCCSGEKPDTVRAKHLIVARIEERGAAYVLLKNKTGKIPFTNAGASGFRSVLSGVQTNLLRSGHTTNEFSISQTDVRLIPAEVRITGKYKTITGIFNLTGAIEKAEFAVTVVG